MTEIFTNVRDEVKKTAAFAWKVALAQNNAIKMVNFLHNFTEYYKHFYTEEEIEFLQFYFNAQMEMMKE